jgi:hypothetical protein
MRHRKAMQARFFNVLSVALSSDALSHRDEQVATGDRKSIEGESVLTLSANIKHINAP